MNQQSIGACAHGGKWSNKYGHYDGIVVIDGKGAARQRSSKDVMAKEQQRQRSNNETIGAARFVLVMFDSKRLCCMLLILDENAIQTCDAKGDGK